jgi:transcriptional regulator with XRE-family HTH domain
MLVTMGCVDTLKAVRETDPVPRKTSRPPGPDDWASERIRHEREQRGWSTAELARRVTLAGVPVRQQTVWQVESGEPRRKLSVGEAATFARVFDIPLAELMMPPEEIMIRSLVEVARAFIEWRRDAGVLAARLLRIAQQISELSPEAVYDATVVEKYSGLSGTSDQAIRELEEITKPYQVITESIRKHGSVWSVIASLRDQVADDTSGPGAGESDGAR